MTKGNGVFKWWTATHENAERFAGPFGTRDEAVAAGLVRAREDECDHYFVGEADRTVVQPLFDADAAAERLIEELGESNVECFDEDGPDDVLDADTLAQALRIAVGVWLGENPGTCIHDFREWHRIEVTAEPVEPAGA